MKPERIDWSQLWNPGPARIYTEAELQRAGLEPPSRTLLLMTGLMLTVWVVSVVAAAPSALRLGTIAFVVMGLVALSVMAARLWRRPNRRLLNVFSWVVVGLILMGIWVLGADQLKSEAGRWWLNMGMGLAIGLNVSLWFLTVWRSDQIAARLRELDEREHAADMARQLAAAQIQPHFLFNTLASLQHWVHSGDARAAVLLTELTAFLRATLPLFNRKLLRLGDEVEAARRYLAVMQLRLGERLRFDVAIDAQAAELQVPPGLLLTLVENAVEHGVQGSLHGADVNVRAAISGTQASIVVQDTGPGCTAEIVEGVGLANSRARLHQAFGDQARLLLHSAPGGGCEARIEWPLAPIT